MRDQEKKEEGRKEGRELVALEMLKAAVPYESILKFTKLSIEEIKELGRSICLFYSTGIIKLTFIV